MRVGASVTRRLGALVGAGCTVALTGSKEGVVCMSFSLGSVVPGPARAGIQPRGYAQVVVVKLPLVVTRVAGRAVGGAFHAGKLPGGGLDLSVFALKPSRASYSVLRGLFSPPPLF